MIGHIRRTALAALTLPALVAATPASAQAAAAPKIDGADTAFMLACTGLVLLMTLPGLALFYAGLVRKKNVLATMAQSAGAVAVVSLLWFALAYSLAFSGDGAYLGNLARVFLRDVGMDTTSSLAKTIPETLFMTYQMTFAIITCALVAGSVADRMRFSAFMLFCGLWLLVVYVPSAHWVWGGGFLSTMGLLDFAGGTVVHINAGVAGLVAALVLGARLGYGKENLAPYDLSLAVVGTGLLWVGWFGFNGGSALASGSRAATAILVTHLAACAGALTWAACEWAGRGKPSVLGAISGAVAGLGTITPASGYILPWHGAVIGVAAGVICFWACGWLKQKLGYDDSLDVFGIHGVGGALGTVLAGVFATGAVSVAADGTGALTGLIDGNPRQVLTQLIGVGVTVAWCAVGTLIVLYAVRIFVPLRVSVDEERDGLDLALHGESIRER